MPIGDLLDMTDGGQFCCGCCRHSVAVSDSSAREGNGFSVQGKKHYAPDTVLEPTHLEIHIKTPSIQDQKIAQSREIQLCVIHTIRCNSSSSSSPPRSITLDGVGFYDLQVRNGGGGGGSGGGGGGGDQVHSSTASDEIESWRYDGHKIYITWKSPFTAQGQTRRVQITYRVKNPVSGIVWNSDPKLGDFAATDHESERARYWLACIDYPAVRTTLDFFIDIPSSFSAFANGILAGETLSNDGNRKLSHWQLLDHPCPSYLCCWAIGDLVVVPDRDAALLEFDLDSHSEKKIGTIPISYIAPRGTAESDLKISFDKTPEIIEWLQRRVQTTFPFRKYYQFVAPHMGGAMENISLVTWDYVLLLDQQFAQDWKTVTDSVNLHECTHSYFGDSLVIRHFEHTWLKESWAKYMESVWIRDVYGDDEGVYALFSQAQSYFDETELYMRPIVTREYDSSWDIFDRHTYPGGAWRIHMLRKLLGEDVFWKGVCKYVRRFYGGGVVETEDFRKCLEQQSGMNLNRFFDQWIFGRGFPRLKIAEFRHDAENRKLTLMVEQVQKETIFDFSLDVVVTFLATDSTANEAKHHVQRYSRTLRFSEGATYAICAIDDCPSGSKPYTVAFDPDQKILFSIDGMATLGEDVLENNASERDTVDLFNRIFSARALCSCSNKSVEKLANIMASKETFWGVRAQVARELAKAKNSACISALVRMIETEQEPRALFWIANSCVGLRDDSIRRALLAFLEKGASLPYRAHAKALEALGSQNHPEHELSSIQSLIIAHADSDQRYSVKIVRSGAFRALGHLHTHDALRFLRQRLTADAASDREKDECREAIVDGIAECASFLDTIAQQQVINLLVDLLRDDDERVRMNAIAALVKLKAFGSVSAVEASRGSFAAQYHSWLNKKITALRKSATEPSGDLKKLEKEVEDMKQLVRKLELKVESKGQ